MKDEGHGLIDVLRLVAVDTLFENDRVRQRAEELFREGACVVESVASDIITGTVRGRTGIYTVRIVRSGDRFGTFCTCPSDYRPCKHAGAFLYTLQALSDAGSPAVASDPPPGGVPERQPAGGESALPSPEEFTPGAVLASHTYRVNERTEANRIRERLAPLVPVATGDREAITTGPAPSNAAAAAHFRPAFKIEPARDPLPGFGPLFVVSPVLVYIRKDRTDGRIESFSPTKQRAHGDEATEELLALMRSRPQGRYGGYGHNAYGYGGSATSGYPALRLLAAWRDAAGETGEAGLAVGPHATAGDASPDAGGPPLLSAPVELYHERVGRERERAVAFRRIVTIKIAWSISTAYDGTLAVSPVVSCEGSDGYSEELDEVLTDYDHDDPDAFWEEEEDPNFRYPSPHFEHDERGLIIPRPATGTLWYVFARDVSGGYQAIAALAELLKLPSQITHGEAEELQRIAPHLSRHGVTIAVQPPPAAVLVSELSPVPVVRVSSAGGGTGHVRLLYRYGALELDPGDERRQVPAPPEEAPPGGEVGDAGHDDTDATADNHTWRVAVRSRRAEARFSMQFQEALEALPWGWAQLGVMVRRSPWEILTTIGPALLNHGFELRLEEEEVRITEHTPRYRVVSSGDHWLEVEAGIAWDGAFYPVEDVVGGTMVRAGGRVYVFGPDTPLPAEFTLSARTIDRGDLLSLVEIEDQLENPDHPALTDFRRLRERLAAVGELTEIGPPHSFQGILRPYQRSGLSWLWYLHRTGLGGILADDMGLGKTVQTLALLAQAREEEELTRAVVVCPVSTMGNWAAESARFVPHLSAVIHSGSRRAATPEALEAADLIFVGYETLLRDVELFQNLRVDYLILDEAQAIKNPGAKRRRAIASLDVAHRLALTGTPVENGTLELWSIVDVVMPGIVGGRTQFSRRFSGATDGSNRHAVEALQRTIRPLVLRRTKRAVAPDLPPREEQIIPVELSGKQAALYESLRARLEAEVSAQLRGGSGGAGAEAAGAPETGTAGPGAAGRGGPAGAPLVILEAMLRLRQAAILPALLGTNHAAVPAAKLDTLVDMVAEIAAEGNKALVFSQFTAVLDEVEERLAGAAATREIPRFRLQGNTPQARRSADIAEFQQQEGAGVFLISLRAGGLGINLTAADYVFLLDPWWNPAVEAQAIDRAHRIGRDRPVFAYRLVARGTIEEKMLRLQEVKRALADALIREDGTALRSLSAEDIQGLFGR